MEKNNRTSTAPDPRRSGVNTSSQSAPIGFALALTGAPVTPLESLEYEAGMFLGALETLRAEPDLLRSRLVKDAMTESAVFHTRRLCEIFLDDDPRTHDVRLITLFPDYPNDPKYRRLELAVKSLRDICGEGAGLPFDKLFVRTTSTNGAYRVSGEAIKQLEPEIVKIFCKRSSP